MKTKGATRSQSCTKNLAYTFSVCLVCSGPHISAAQSTVPTCTYLYIYINKSPGEHIYIKVPP